MHLSNRHLRINLAESKALMMKKLGPDLSRQYFTLLNMFLSFKVTKLEFNKLCVRFVGRENIPLHNHLIRSILRNASSAKIPPPTMGPKDGVLKRVRTTDIGYYPNGFHNGTPLPSGSPCLLNGGDILSIPHQKAKMGIHDTKSTGDHLLSGLGHNRTNDVNTVLENGDLQHHQEICARSPIRLPFGVQLFSCSSHRSKMGAVNDSSLLDSFTLQERMQRIALANGLEGMSMDSADVLSHGLDVYIKGLITSSADLAELRSENELTKPDFINKPCNNTEVVKHRCPISLHDFKVSMEVNPSKLGEEWPVLLERICIRSFEE